MRSRQAIIDATRALIESGGFAAVNVSAVAARAGVTRQTVYSNFGTKEDLVSLVVAGVAQRMLADVQARLAPIADPSQYVAELIVAARAAMRTEPVIGALLDGASGNPLFDDGMMARARPVADAILAPLRERSEVLAEDDAAFADVAELITRLGLSVVLFDSDAVRDDDALRAFVRRWVRFPDFDTRR